MIAARSVDGQVICIYELRKAERYDVGGPGWRGEFRVIWETNIGPVNDNAWRGNGAFPDREYTFFNAPESEKWVVSYSILYEYEVEVTGANETEATENFWTAYYDNTHGPNCTQVGDPQAVHARLV